MGFNYEDMHCAIISQAILNLYMSVLLNLRVLQYNHTPRVAEMPLAY